MHKPRTSWKKMFEKVIKSHGVLAIADEVMDGIWKRREKHFASPYMEVKRIIICMPKALTAGMLAMA